ncbi:hypothetical protein ACEWY4_014547 [Coilia grayii]|uniref:Uncharacterized protein n=1 Tax=Coilia grayii TaxID=363190 RepID=A0ABD1JSK9_9TELE
MAEASIPVAENHFQCPICIELLKDPVTIPCGHTYCMDCIKKCWDKEEEKNVYSCPQCRQTFNPRPVLCRNPILADMVAKLKAQGLQNVQNDEVEFAGPGDVECTICIGRKRKADKSCLECLDSYCALHFCRHEELLSGKKHKVVEATVQLQSKMCLEHGKPLEAFCNTDKKCVCVACITDQHKGHDVVSPANAKKDKEVELKWKLQTEISNRETELKKLADNADSLKSSAQTSVETMESGFAELLVLIEQKRAEVVEMIRAKERAELSRAEQLQEEIRVLKKKTADMEQLGSKEDDIHFLQNLPLLSPDDLPHFAFNGNYSFYPPALKSYCEVIMKKLKEVCNENVGHIWRHVNFRFLQSSTVSKSQWEYYSCKPKLDKNTAFRHHEISEEDTKVEWSHEVLCWGRNWPRFTDCRQVLCEDAAPQVAYWKVKWESERDYEISIAVAYDDIERRGDGNKCRFGRNDKSWCLERSDSSLSFFHNNIETEIPGPIPSEVGVYLNQKEGILAFYDMDRCDPEIIFRVQARFTKPLYPGFYVTSFCSVEIF